MYNQIDFIVIPSESEIQNTQLLEFFKCWLCYALYLFA